MGTVNIISRDELDGLFSDMPHAGCVQIMHHELDAVTFRAVIFDKDFKVLWQSNDDEVMYTSSKAAVRAAYRILSTKDGLAKALRKQQVAV